MICRSLAEDIFLYDDVVASLRKKELVTGMLAVTVSADTLEKFHAKRGSNVILTDNEPVQSDYELLLRIVRANPANEGWLIRWSRAVTELDAQRTSHVRRTCFLPPAAPVLLTPASLVIGASWGWRPSSFSQTPRSRNLEYVGCLLGLGHS